MSSDWYATTLGEICKFTAGSAFKPEHQGGTSGQYPFIKVSDMNLSGNEIFICHANNFVSSELKDGMNAKEHPAGATVFAKIGVALQSNRRRLLVKPTIIDNNMMSATPKTGKVSSRFLYFVLSTLDFNTISAGSALPYLNVSDLQKMSVRIPRDAKVQQAIENVLGAIDDRISLLRETNTTLEAIAQALFKSWFVDFDPVHAKIQGLAPEGVDEATAALFPDSFEESELGPLPKGWKWMSLNDAYEINPTRKLKKGDTAAYLDMAGVQTQGHSVSGVVQREMGSGTKFMNGDTLLARITPCLENGKTAFVDFLPADQTGWGSTEFVVLRPKDPLPKYHAYLLARHPAFREHAIRSMSGTSGRQRIQNDVLSQFLVAVPNEPIAKAFSELVMTIHESIREGHLQVSTLSELRDTLLPRLISGRVDLQAATTSKPVEV
jgi:type I restriction enzyme S subunit